MSAEEIRKIMMLLENIETPSFDDRPKPVFSTDPNLPQYTQTTDKMCRIIGSPEQESAYYHGGACPEGWVTVSLEHSGYDYVYYVPADQPKQDEQGWYLPAGSYCIVGGGRGNH
jgi:hypothetical protein